MFTPRKGGVVGLFRGSTDTGCRRLRIPPLRPKLRTGSRLDHTGLLCIVLQRGDSV